MPSIALDLVLCERSFGALARRLSGAAAGRPKLGLGFRVWGARR